ncbi:tetratricopeptide repeat protein [Butyricicoccus porcorum]|nr:tetratricopeptide repeat protein [Butyricicoccus porcorum]
MNTKLATRQIRLNEWAAESPSAYLPDLAMSCNNLGVLYRQTNRLKEAEAEYLRAKEIYEQLAAENPSAYMFDLASTYYNLGLLYMTLKDIEQAVEYFRKAKEGFIQTARGNPAYEKYVQLAQSQL